MRTNGGSHFILIIRGVATDANANDKLSVSYSLRRTPNIGTTICNDRRLCDVGLTPGPRSEYYLLNFLVTLTPKSEGIIDARVKCIMRSGAW